MTFLSKLGKVMQIAGKVVAVYLGFAPGLAALPDDVLYGDNNPSLGPALTGGDDFLDGEAGDDTLFGGMGNDTLIVFVFGGTAIVFVAIYLLFIRGE